MPMRKPAQTGTPVHDLIRERWSPRAFADRPVDQAVLRSVFEAARWAASCFNDQPWSFIVATREEPTEFDRLLGCLLPGNQAWARAAPVLMISVARLAFNHNGKPNRHAYHDVGQAAAQLTMQASNQGLVVHQMGGIDLGKIRQTYAVPDGHDPVAGLALGYQGPTAALPEEIRERELAPRQRMPLAEMVFSGAFGRPAGPLT